MVISNNKTQARKYFRTLFGSSYDESVEQTAHFWAKTNLEVYAYGTAKMGSRFAVVRIEDLCGPDREVHIAKLARAIGLDLDKAVEQADTFRVPDSFGRGRAIAVDSLSSPVREEFNEALARFGYA
jgi:hypothetical protein